MPEQCNYLLKPYSIDYCKEAFRLIMSWAVNCNGDIGNAFNATSKLSNYCRVVVSPSDEIIAVIYPDYDRFETSVLMIHSVLSSKGIMACRRHIHLFRQYVDEMFTEYNFHKIVLEFPDFTTLNTRLAESIGMKQEARLREEWPLNGEWYDILRFGILQDEWRVQNG